MKARVVIELVLDVVLVAAMLFLTLFAFGRFFSAVGTPMRDGYVSGHNVNNVALGVVAVVICGYVALKLLLRRVITVPLEFTQKIAQFGLFFICMMVVYGIIYMLIFADSSRVINLFKGVWSR